MELTQQKKEILKLLVSDLKDIHGIMAIVLGGSYATGHASETSDFVINKDSSRKCRHVSAFVQ